MRRSMPRQARAIRWLAEREDLKQGETASLALCKGKTKSTYQLV